MQYSPKLKKAAEEIKAILRKHDIAGQVVLSSGDGFSEFVNHLDPSWSAVKFEGDYMRVRAKLADFGGDKEAWSKKIGDTVNMIASFRDNAGRTYLSFDELINKLKDHVEIQENRGGITGHTQQNN